MLLAFTEKIDSTLSKVIEAYSPVAEKLNFPSLDHLSGSQELLVAVLGAILLTGFIEAVFKPAVVRLTQRLLLDNISGIWQAINKKVPKAIGCGMDIDETYETILWMSMGQDWSKKPAWAKKAAIAALKAEYSPSINARKIREMDLQS